MTHFRKVSEQLVHQGNVVSFWEGTFVGPDGTEFTRDIVRHPGAVSIVPLFDDGTVVLVRQYRAAVEAELLEIPAGKLDVDGEPLEVCAARELEEEVGCRAERLEELVGFAQSPGFCDEINHVFLATGLTEVPQNRQGIEEEHMVTERFALADVPRLVADGTIIDAKSIVGLLLTIERVAAGLA
jgi:8-oxo-dGTP pyrophosphatase MutT (NUDIX family)